MTSANRESEKALAPAAERYPSGKGDFAAAKLVLRFLVFASAVAAVVVMVTSKQTEAVARSPIPPFVVFRTARFRHSPAFIYFVAALSLVGLYNIIAILFSLGNRHANTKVAAHLIILDVLMLGIMASATGAGGAVAYIGLKGNKHVLWDKICNVYDKFCRHVGASLAVSLFGSGVLTLLILVSIYSLSKKIPR